MSRRPFFKLYFDDFANGCREAAMTPEEVGFYIMSLGLIWRTEGKMPADPRHQAAAIGWGTKICRRLSAQLQAKGKLISAAEGYLTNDRMEREITAYVNVQKAAEAREQKRREAVSKPVQTDFKPVSKPTQNKVESVSEAKLINEINKTGATEKAENDHIAEARSQKPDKEAAATIRGLPQTKPEWDALANRLEGACNGALADPGKRLGMQSLQTPISWIHEGCDVDLDIVPTLADIGRRSHGKNIKTWGYFTDAVREAKERRVNGLPPAKLRPAKASQQERFRRAAEAAAEEEGRKP